MIISVLLSLQRPDLLEAADETLGAVELRADERCDQFAGERGADDASAQPQHVHIVVLDALREPKWLYFLNVTVGRKGLLTLSPVLMYCIPSRSGREKSLE